VTGLETTIHTNFISHKESGGEQSNPGGVTVDWSNAYAYMAPRGLQPEGQAVNVLELRGDAQEGGAACADCTWWCSNQPPPKTTFEV